jgi:hypothetical protein
VHITVTDRREVKVISARRIRAWMHGMDLLRDASCIAQDLHQIGLVQTAELEHVTRVARELEARSIQDWVRVLDRHQPWWVVEEEEEEEVHETVQVRWKPNQYWTASKWTDTEEEEEAEERQEIRVYRGDWWL